MFSSSRGMNQEEACHREGHVDSGLGEPTEEEWVCLLQCSESITDVKNEALSFMSWKQKRRKEKKAKNQADKQTKECKCLKD